MINKHTREEMRGTGVYEIVHVASGKMYVGSASYQFGQRLRAHKHDLRKNKHGSILLQRAWNKYGEDAFEFRIAEQTKPEHAVGVEQTFIDWRNSTNPKLGYNISPTAGNCRGCVRSEETREKIRQNTKRQFANPESRKTICASRRKRFEDIGEREKVGEHFRKYYSDPQNIEKMRERHLKRWEDPSKRLAYSDVQKKRLEPKEVRKKQKESANRRWSDPNERRAQGERAKRITGTPEARIAAREKTNAVNADPERKARMQEKNRATRAAKKLLKLKAAKRTKQGVLFEC
jgi:group I intron endonuclease